MKILSEQIQDTNLQPAEVVREMCDMLDIEERGGGPEGLYYTHPHVAGEFLYRNLPVLTKDIVIVIAQKVNAIQKLLIEGE